MKKYLLAIMFIASTAVMFTSCSKDEENLPTPTETPIVAPTPAPTVNAHIANIKGTWIASHKLYSSWDFASQHEFTQALPGDTVVNSVGATIFVNGEFFNTNPWVSTFGDSLATGFYNNLSHRYKVVDNDLKNGGTFNAAQHWIYMNNINWAAASNDRIISITSSRMILEKPDGHIYFFNKQ